MTKLYTVHTDDNTQVFTTRIGAIAAISEYIDFVIEPCTSPTLEELTEQLKSKDSQYISVDGCDIFFCVAELSA